MLFINLGEWDLRDEEFNCLAQVQAPQLFYAAIMFE